MTTTRRQTLALLGSSALAASCTPALVTRNDLDPFEGGIGGTGIVGALYGFGSLRINGLRVELNAGTRYRTPFGNIGAEMLEPGQVLTVSAQRRPDQIVAQDVMVDYALVGTLHQRHGRLSVNNVPLIDAASALGHGAPGARVAVSGTWTANGVRPSRIDAAPVGPDLIAGTVTQGGDGGSGIGGTGISVPDGLATPGSYVVAFGRSTNGGFDVDRVQSGRFNRINNLQLLSVDGYLEPSSNAPGFRIAGLGHSFARDLRLAAIGARRAIYFGRYDGLFGATSAYIVPDALAARRRLLEPGLGLDTSVPLIRL